MAYIPTDPIPFPARNRDMLGQQVVITPIDILSEMVTYGLPSHIWRSENLAGGDGVATTVDGHLFVSSGTVNGGITRLTTKSHPRYHPDQQWGVQWASTGLPIGSRVTIRVGQFTTWNGWFISVNCATGVATYYARKTTGVVAPAPPNYNNSGLGAATITDTPVAVTIPTGVDLSKATLFDLQGLWRGVGDQRLLLNLEQGATTDRLGISTDYWTSNPALPFAIEIERHTPGDNAAFTMGCVRVATWGTNGSTFDFRPFETNNVALDNAERPLVIAQAAGFLAGMPCTRDHAIKYVGSVTCDAVATVRIYRNATLTAVGAGTWSIPDPTRGLVWFIGSNTSTMSNVGAEPLVAYTFAAGEKVDFNDSYWNMLPLRPIPGTLTTGANRGNPAYGETFMITVQKSAGGVVNASATPVIGSKY